LERIFTDFYISTKNSAHFLAFKYTLFPLQSTIDETPTSFSVYNNEFTLDGLTWNHERDTLATKFGEIIAESSGVYDNLDYEMYSIFIQNGEYFITFDMHNENSEAFSAWIRNCAKGNWELCP